jgi:SNF2 family DNA or RNA helicase
VRDLDPRLHDYQVRAIQHLHEERPLDRGAALFMDMGLGKTAVNLQALTPERLPALVCAPLRVAEEVWEVEVEKWRPDLSVRTLTKVGPTKRFPKAGDRRDHMLRKDVDADITVISRDQISVMGTKVHPYNTLILDEFSGYKNKGTARWKATRDVLRQANLRQGTVAWGLTGTPAPNGYADLYGQVFMLDAGRRLGDTLEKFRERYLQAEAYAQGPQGKVVTKWGLKPGSEQAINRLLADLALSMKAEDYLKDLPGLHVNEVRVPMTGLAARAYERMEEDLVADLSILGGPSVVHTSANAAVLTSRLQQISAGFLYEDADQVRGPVRGVSRLNHAKTEALGEVMDGTGDNVLVFYGFDEERKDVLDKFDYAVSIDEPGAVKAWNRKEIRMLLAHPASAGYGLNLQGGGSTQAWLTLPWALEWWQQGVGRSHRQGQERDVIVHWLNGSPMDAVVADALVNKKDVQDALMYYLQERHLFL